MTPYKIQKIDGWYQVIDMNGKMIDFFHTRELANEFIYKVLLNDY